jgi:hypothetical protein
MNIITQDDFQKMAPRAPRKLNTEFPAPPPPLCSTTIFSCRYSTRDLSKICTNRGTCSPASEPCTSQSSDGARPRKDQQHRRASRFYALTKDGHPPDTAPFESAKQDTPKIHQWEVMLDTLWTSGDTGFIQALSGKFV